MQFVEVFQPKKEAKASSSTQGSRPAETRPKQVRGGQIPQEVLSKDKGSWRATSTICSRAEEKLSTQAQMQTKQSEVLRAIAKEFYLITAIWIALKNNVSETILGWNSYLSQTLPTAVTTKPTVGWATWANYCFWKKHSNKRIKQIYWSNYLLFSVLCDSLV